MYEVKGFLKVKPWIDNSVGQIAPIGELSNYAMTYSRELGYYSDNAYSNIELITFLVSQNDSSVTLPSNYRDEMLPILHWIYSEADSGSFSNDASLFVDALIAQWPNEIDSIETGSMVEGDTTGVYVPTFIQFQLLNVAESNTIRVWLADNAFRQQYDEYEIVVVPPIPNVDDLINDPNIVETTLNDVTPIEWQQRIESAKNFQPPTITRVQTYTWTYPSGSTELSTSWALIIYGRAGNTIDAIKQKIKDFVLGQSSHPRSTWEDYIPDLFRLTEVVIIPFWDQRSIPNETLEAGLYSPSVPITRVLPTAKQVIQNYTDAHIEQNVHTSVTMYRNLAFMAIASPENRAGYETFKSIFSDYVSLPTTSSEFDRMSQYTRDWIDLFFELLQVAETMDELSSVPLDKTRLFRGSNDEHMYIVATYDNIQYLVLARKSYLETVNALFP